ncbi:MAG: hypothetical protein HY231_04895 [Acidobacteria bacterium]|nr:hypothetical protein [Acidobacteriota bacterium]
MKRHFHASTLLLLALGVLLTGGGWPAASFSQAGKKSAPSVKAPAPAAPKNAATTKAAYLGYDEAKPILEALRDALPAALQRASAAELPSLWPQWVAARDAEIRSRLLQGDEDSVINFLLFGMTFTRRPRITLDALAQAGKEVNNSANNALLDAIKLRADDLIQGILSPGTNERLLFARRLAVSKGFDLQAATARTQLQEYLLGTLSRVLNEQSSYARILEAARLLGDPSQEFVERSKLYSARGLSSDTSLLPNFALEKTLEAITAQGLLTAGSVRRVAIVGPGLDFTDKQDGYDFYPQQTIQPFAVIDTLLRLGLAKANDLQLTTLDLSPRINDHLTRSRQRALAGQPYIVQLPRDEKGLWKEDAIAYWNRFGDRIGTSATPVAVPPGAIGLKVRAVAIRPEIVRIITPQDLNIVLQRLNRPAGEGFDLIIATNILVYYEVFEQSLALKNVEAMLRPGGFLLSNNALLELPTTNVHSLNYTTVVYSDKPNDGDHIVWYQRDGK